MRQLALILCVSIGILVASGTGCEGETVEPPPKPEPTTQPSAEELARVRDMVADEPGGPDRAGSQDLPPGHPPLPDQAAATPPANRPPASDLTWETPAGWQEEPVRSSMRKAQYRLPRAADDEDDGLLTVFYFGPGGGGGVDANVQRWRGQFSTPEGEAVSDEQFTRRKLEVENLDITFVEVQGTFSPGAMRMGGSPPPPKEGYHLLAAIVETPGGPWYFKAVGPTATIQQHRDAFMSFLKSMSAE